MKREEIIERIGQISQEYLGADITTKAGSTDQLFTRMGEPSGAHQFDSLDKVELVMAIEAEFDLDLPDSIVANINTADHLIETVVTRVIGPRHGDR